jgi:F0F1-type ATP synthase assembly protein I
LKNRPTPEDKNAEPSPEPSEGKSPREFGRQSALAMELPFTLVGAVIFGGLLGYFADKWLHSSPWLTMILGGLGFFAGVREVIRRLPDGSGKS